MHYAGLEQLLKVSRHSILQARRLGLFHEVRLAMVRETFPPADLPIRVTIANDRGVGLVRFISRRADDLR